MGGGGDFVLNQKNYGEFCITQTMARDNKILLTLVGFLMN